MTTNDIATKQMSPPSLDEDISVLEEWDRLRKKADSFRREGVEALCASLEPDEDTKKQLKYEWVDNEPEDRICPALVFLAASREFVSNTNVQASSFLLSKGTHTRDPLLDRIRELSDPAPQLLDELRAADLNEPEEELPKGEKEIVEKRRRDFADAKKSELEKLLSPLTAYERETARVPIFQAARLLQALLSAPETVFSYPAVLAYYIVVRELSTVHTQKPILGCARSREESEPTAFVTGECARAISGMARALRRTADLVETFSNLALEWSELERAPAAKAWKEAEQIRLALAAFNDMNVAARKGAIPLKLEGEDITQDFTGTDFPAYFTKVCGLLEKSSKRAELGIHLATMAIDAWHKKRIFEIEDGKISINESKESAVDREELTHKIAKRTISDACNTASMAGKAAAAMKAADLNDDKAFGEARTKFKNLADELRKRAKDVDRLLNSTKVYLTSVIDREIQKHATHQLNAGELACAAASYAALVRPEFDPRLSRAAQILCEKLSIDGTFGSSSILDTDEHGYNLVAVTSEIHRAFAYLLQKVPIEVTTETFRRLLSFFESKVVTSNGKIVGWPHDQCRKPVRAARWTSAIAILALDRIARMLGERINQRVFRHFSVTRHDELKKLRNTPELSKLFYSDYGLARFGGDKKYGHMKLGKQSIAHILECMRSHVQGNGTPPGTQDDVYSLILFGPPGTGKTTLIESLAATGRVSFVEITPSDFLVSGGAMIERRARQVMRALSYLSQAVILFDEFDPIVRSRDLQPESLPLNEFAFVTPGMLPKLKWLHDCAEKQQVAYCLITNRIGVLDEAAIRSGRFDYKVGVYPPDLLSRAGRLAYVMSQRWTLDAKRLDRIARVVNESAGKGMTTLGKPGNFTPLPKEKEPKECSIQKYILDGKNCPPSDQDADPDELPAGAGVYRDREFDQWSWVIEWDERIEDSPTWEKIQEETTAKTSADPSAKPSTPGPSESAVDVRKKVRITEANNKKEKAGPSLEQAVGKVGEEMAKIYAVIAEMLKSQPQMDTATKQPSSLGAAETTVQDAVGNPTKMR